MSNRDNFIDAMGGLDEKLFAEHVARKYPSRAYRIKRYAMAAGIYVAACLVVALILPYIIGSPEQPGPISGDEPVRTETYAVSSGTAVETEMKYLSETVTESGTEEATVTDSETVTETEPATQSQTTESVTVEESMPPESPSDDITPSPTPAVTVHTPRTEPAETQKVQTQKVTAAVSSESIAATTTTVTTTKRPDVTTPVRYPEPYISDVTLTSVTVKLWGCDYTVSVDKPLYRVGDIVRVTLTLTNNGDKKLDFVDEVTHKNFLDSVKLYGNWRLTAYSGEGPSKRATLMPGDTWTYVANFDTTKLHPGIRWYLDARLTYYVDGKQMETEAGFAVCHEEMPYDMVTNPFRSEEFGYYISDAGTKGLYVIMENETGPNWEEYLNEEFLGFEIDRIERNENSEVLNDIMYPYQFSIFLKDTSNESMVTALYRMAELDKQTNFVYEVYVAD